MAHDVAGHARNDALRAKMALVEEARYTADFYDETTRPLIKVLGLCEDAGWRRCR